MKINTEFNGNPDDYRDFDPSILIGHTVVEASTETNSLTLDNGTVIEFEESVHDCCSYLQLTELHTTRSIITDAGTEDDQHETDGEGPYNAWVYVITDGGEKAIVEAAGDAGSGYYLHGFALEAKITPPDQE